MQQKSITDSNNVTQDAFSHASDAQRENTNSIYTGDKLYKSDKQVDSVKNSKINDAKYYESNTATVSDAQVNLTHNSETFTHTCNRNFEQRLLIYQTIPVLTLPMNPGIYKGIAAIILINVNVRS